MLLRHTLLRFHFIDISLFAIDYISRLLIFDFAIIFILIRHCRHMMPYYILLHIADIIFAITPLFFIDYCIILPHDDWLPLFALFSFLILFSPLLSFHFRYAYFHCFHFIEPLFLIFIFFDAIDIYYYAIAALFSVFSAIYWLHDIMTLIFDAAAAIDTLSDALFCRCHWLLWLFMACHCLPHYFDIFIYFFFTPFLRHFSFIAAAGQPPLRQAPWCWFRHMPPWFIFCLCCRHFRYIYLPPCH